MNASPPQHPARAACMQKGGEEEGTRLFAALAGQAAAALDGVRDGGAGHDALIRPCPSVLTALSTLGALRPPGTVLPTASCQQESTEQHQWKFDKRTSSTRFRIRHKDRLPVGLEHPAAVLGSPRLAACMDEEKQGTRLVVQAAESDAEAAREGRAGNHDVSNPQNAQTLFPSRLAAVRM